MMKYYFVLSDDRIYYFSAKDDDDLFSLCKYLVDKCSSYVFGFSDWDTPEVKLIFHYHKEV